MTSLQLSEIEKSLIRELRVEPRSRRTTQSIAGVPCWLVSFAVHGVLCVLFLFGFDRRGAPDGRGLGDLDTALVLTATFGTEEVPGDAGGQVGIDVATGQDPQGVADAEDVGQPPAQDMPPEQPTEDVAVAEDLPQQPEEGPAVIQPVEEPAEELVASSVPAVTGLRQVAVRATPAPDGAAGQHDSLEENGAGGNGEGQGKGMGRQAGFGSPDGTSFFQINAQGQHFCYVIDCSSSMEEDNIIEFARRELRASLLRLDSKKKFQIVFYDADLHILTNGGETIFNATDVNRRLARQFMSSQQPTGRALHKLALTAALQSKPDVIFFLTDGEVPELTARELADLKSQNRRRTQIHVVEFGRGAKLERTWLDQLARDNRGNYRYRDIEAQASAE